MNDVRYKSKKVVQGEKQTTIVDKNRGGKGFYLPIKKNQKIIQKKGIQKNGALVDSRSGGVVQRQIQLVDTDDGLYEETEDAKATPKGTEFYYVNNDTTTGLPIFVNKGAVDDLERRLEEIMAGNMTKKQKSEAELLALYGVSKNAHFFTSNGPIEPNQKHFRLKQALSHPLFKDPDRARGLEHRFAKAEGVLFSKLTKEKTEEEIGALPDTVQFYQIPSSDWAIQVSKYKGFWTEVTANYAYGRHMNLRGVTPRSERSKFRQGTDSTTDDNVFSGNDKAGALPPVGAENQSSGWIEYKAYANPKSRGKGQYKAMNNWNALAYAAYMFHHGHPEVNLGQDWEWLHIRGAQNGGVTNADNLVAGTSTTNSRMIPWEDQINLWTKHAKGTHPLSVNYIGKRVSGTDLGKKIEIQIAAENGLPQVLKPVKKSAPLTITFDPLNGTVYDKVSNKITSKTLVEEAYDDTFRRNQTLKVVNFIKGRKDKLKMFRVIYKSPYKGLNAEFKQFYPDNRALVFVGAVMKQAVVPLWQLQPIE